MKDKIKKSSGNIFKDITPPIETEEQYEATLKRIEQIWSAKPNTPEGAELEALSELVEAYEEIHYPIPAPTELVLDSDILDFFGRDKKGKKRIAKVLRKYVRRICKQQEEQFWANDLKSLNIKVVVKIFHK